MDHVALASPHAWDQLTRYQHELGAGWLGGPSIDEANGFFFCQVELDRGTKLEFLEPLPGEGSDFLRRFLERNGSGPHHFTFKVPDFDAAVTAVEEAGYDVVGIDRSDPDWQEGFLHPKQSHGIVIQLAHHAGEDEGWSVQQGLPPTRRAAAPKLLAVDHLVADLNAAVSLFTGPLGMTEAERGENSDGSYTVVESGPWRLRLVSPTHEPWRQWLGARTGRLLRLDLALDEPGVVRGARPLGDGCYELDPEQNLGTRLRLRPSDGMAGGR